jgi:hypothetical protein
MDRLLRAAVLGIGMLIGIIRPEAPSVSCRVYRDEEAVYVNVEVVGAFPGEAVELLESGNPLELVFLLSPAGYGEIVRTHAVRYDPLSRIHTLRIVETGEEHRTENLAAVLDIASRATGVRLFAAGDFDAARGLALGVSCELHSPGMDASALWNYGRPETRIHYASLSGIPR